MRAGGISYILSPSWISFQGNQEQEGFHMAFGLETKSKVPEYLLLRLGNREPHKSDSTP